MRRIVCRGRRLRRSQTQRDTLNGRPPRFAAKAEMRRDPVFDRESGRISACLFPSGLRAEWGRWQYRFLCRAGRLRSARDLVRSRRRLRWLRGKRRNLPCTAACRVRPPPPAGPAAKPGTSAEAQDFDLSQRSWVALAGWPDRLDSVQQQKARENSMKGFAKGCGRAGKYACVRDHSQTDWPCEVPKRYENNARTGMEQAAKEVATDIFVPAGRDRGGRLSFPKKGSRAANFRVGDHSVA